MRRVRFVLVVVVLGVAGALVVPGGVSAVPARGRCRPTAFVANSGSGTVSTIDVKTRIKNPTDDSLTALAQFFGVAPAAIVAANHLNGDQLTAGQVLQIPPRPPGQLVVSPPDAPIGKAFKLNLTGAKAGEIVAFEIDTPDGGKYSGSPHTAAQDGSVTATYQTASGDTAGTYTVVATGDHGTSLRATSAPSPARRPHSRRTRTPQFHQMQAALDWYRNDEYTEIKIREGAARARMYVVHGVV
jgi:LysM repeat protein